MKIMKTIIILLAVMCIILFIVDWKYYIDFIKGIFVTIVICFLTMAMIAIFDGNASEM